MADVAHSAPIHGERRKTACSSVISQRIQERVSGNVIGLTGIAGDGGNRREQDEEVQWGTLGQRVEIPGAHEFRRHGLPHPFLGQIFDRRVVQYHGGVHDAPQRTHALSGGDRLLCLVTVGDVSPANHHLDAALPQESTSACAKREGSLRPTKARWRAPRRANGRPRPIRNRQAAGDQVAGVGIVRRTAGVLDLQSLGVLDGDDPACRYAWPAP